MFTKIKDLNKFSYFLIFIVSLVIIKMIVETKEDNTDKCKLKELKLIGIINGKSGHGSYSYVGVDNLKKVIRISINETKYIKGFPEDYTYEVGDSIIKKAGSMEFTVKRGNNIAVHIIDCDD